MSYLNASWRIDHTSAATITRIAITLNDPKSLSQKRESPRFWPEAFCDEGSVCIEATLPRTDSCPITINVVTTGRNKALDTAL